MGVYWDCLPGYRSHGNGAAKSDWLILPAVCNTREGPKLFLLNATYLFLVKLQASAAILETERRMPGPAAVTIGRTKGHVQVHCLPSLLLLSLSRAPSSLVQCWCVPIRVQSLPAAHPWPHVLGEIVSPSPEKDPVSHTLSFPWLQDGANQEDEEVPGCQPGLPHDQIRQRQSLRQERSGHPRQVLTSSLSGGN